MKQYITSDWQQILADEFDAPYFKALQEYIEGQYKEATIFPAKEHIFAALNETPFAAVKVVILGQDPYHGEGQAHGLSFSVQKSVAHPPSLRNMFKELEDDIGAPIPVDGTLTKWAKQGVLLLNTVLTVRKGEANAHKNQGWEKFTDKVIELLAKREEPIVFILWGKPAQSKTKLIQKYGPQHAILQAPHPSPLSSYRGFFGSKPYSVTNEHLQRWGKTIIDWNLSS